MGSTVELRYGFKNPNNLVKKVLKLSIKMSDDSSLEDLVVIQHDDKFSHTTVHSERGTKSSRRHIQLDYPELFAEEDRNRFPEILHAPLPDLKTLDFGYLVQAIPVHWGAEVVRDIYDPMKPRHVQENRHRIVDLSVCREGHQYLGNFEVYLLPPEKWTPAQFSEMTRRPKDDVSFVDIYGCSRPWVAVCFHARMYRSREGMWPA